MDTTNWTSIVLIALLVFCCVPMLFMGRRRGRNSHGTSEKREADDEHGNK